MRVRSNSVVVGLLAAVALVALAGVEEVGLQLLEGRLVLAGKARHAVHHQRDACVGRRLREAREQALRLALADEPLQTGVERLQAHL